MGTGGFNEAKLMKHFINTVHHLTAHLSALQVISVICNYHLMHIYVL